MSSLQGKLSALVLCATALVFCNPARADLVTNGGFETGSFSGWTGTGNTVFNGVTCPGPGATVHGGNCAAFLDQLAALAVLARISPRHRVPHTASIFSFCLMAVTRALLAQHSVGPR